MEYNLDSLLDGIVTKHYCDKSKMFTRLLANECTAESYVNGVEVQDGTFDFFGGKLPTLMYDIVDTFSCKNHKNEDIPFEFYLQDSETPITLSRVVPLVVKESHLKIKVSEPCIFQFTGYLLSDTYRQSIKNAGTNDNTLIDGDVKYRGGRLTV